MNAPNQSPNWIFGAAAVFWKDFRLEFRNKSVLGTLIIFVLSTLFIVLFAIGRRDLSPEIEAGLLWIIVLFTAALGLGRTFLSEQERSTGMFLRLHTQGIMVYFGKLLFSFLTILCANSISVIVYLILLSIEVSLTGLFVLTMILGTLGLAGATTLLAAIISQTARGGPLLPVLLFPLLIPLLLSAVEVTQISITVQPSVERAWSAATGSLITMGSFSGVVIAASVLLFDYVWEE
ncbi:MAG: heme exporter protein CcmB [Bacteroidetes bacterium]|nr:heme exporter protein CcmB [Bacteroidota bacterium]